MIIGKVYKIVCKTNPKIVYIGSTIDKLSRRWRRHCHSSSVCVISKYIKEYGIENFNIVLIKEYNVCDKFHLLAYEQLYMNTIKNINVRNAFNILGKEKWKEYHKNYYENNKEKIIEKVKEYYENNREKWKEKITCECGCIINKYILSRHKKSNKHIELMENLNQ
jgi:glycosylphosphatidylinositol transamidase (GPIT) subunit GPI8